MRLPKKYFQNDDVVFLAKDLIGKKLCVKKNGNLVSGIITETEAYKGIGDAACHGRVKTPRTLVMHGDGGFIYTYLCYGIHTLFNIVTNTSGFADAILIRSIVPVEGLETMLKNVNKKPGYKFDGPGKVTKGLGIELADYGKDLENGDIWLQEGIKIEQKDILVTPRIGIDYAGDDALLPRRFFVSQENIKKYLN